jgi:O-antigen ligase
MLVRHPLFGVGPGGYRAEFSTTKLAMIDDGATFWWGHTDGSLFANAHNEPIEVGAELGVLGLVTLGWCAWVLLGELRRRPVPPTDDPVDDDRRALQWAGLAALAVLSATYFPLRTALVAYPYVLLLAWMLEPRGVLAEDDGAAAAAARLAAPKEVAA